MIAAAALAAAALLAPASAGAGGPPRPPASLAVSPPHVALVGRASSTVRVSNPGAQPVVVEVQRAGFGLDLRGRPRIVGRAASGWLRFRPQRLVLGPGATAPLTVTSALGRRAEPGDHEALVLLTTRVRPAGRVAVRMRLGVVVAVRVPGRVVHRLVARSLRVRRAGVLELLVANRGNVTEPLGRVHVVLRGRRLQPQPRDLLPRTRGIVRFRYDRLHGPARAVVELPRTEVRRAFRLVLP
jgi:hypothetical protein